MSNGGNERNTWDKKRLFIESLVAILCAIIGVIYGKSTNNTFFYNGQKVSETELNQIMEENAEFKSACDYLKTENAQLSNRISELLSENLEYEEENKKILSENETMRNSIADAPVIEFQNCGLSINGNEVPINKDKSYVEINGRQYFSREFTDSLLPDNMTTTMKNDMLYIGKIIREKISLFDLVRIKDAGYEKQDNIVDTYGNSYSNVLYFRHSGWGITYSAEREYTNFKCVVAMKENSGGRGYIQIETDDESYTYISPEITNLTEAFEIDIPINYTSTITIKCVNGSDWCNIFVSNPTLYNQE